MWIAHRYNRVHTKSSKFKPSKVCGVKIYTIQLHLKMSNFTFIPLGYSLKRVNESLLFNMTFKVTVATRTKNAGDGNMINRVVRLVEVGCKRST